MTDSANYTLSLKGFESNIKTYWQKLQLENDFFDVTLACEDKQIEAHKLIISSCSPILRNILKLNKTAHPLIYLRRVKFKDLQNLLEFMYQGEVNVFEKDLTSFMEVAEDLKIGGIFEENMEDIPGFKEVAKDQKIGGIFEENIPSFMEVAKDMKTGKKFEENMEDLDSHGTNLTQSSHQNNKSLYAPIRKPLCADNYKQNVISTLKNQELRCKICDKMFSNRKDLHCHSTAAHGAILIHPCGQCSYETKNIHHLKKHVKSIHEGEVYPCGKCDYKATQDSNLKQHIKSIHEGKRHPCDQCHYTSGDRSSLRRHVKTVHKGEYYPCDQCNYKAKQSSHLRQHVNSIHEGERHPCDQCEYKATQKGTLNKHKLKYH